jgi:hypothetical protein
MTVDTTDPIKRYPYTGVGEFPFGFQVYVTDHIVVFHTDGTGLESELATTQYTVELSETEQGGAVTVTDEDLVDGTLTIKRVLEYEQDQGYKQKGRFDMEVHERKLDSLVMMIQQVATEVSSGVAEAQWKGDWIAEYVYEERNMVVNPTTENVYFCVLDHTAGTTFEDDLALGYWRLVLDVEQVLTYTNQAAGSASIAASAEATVVPLAEDVTNMHADVIQAEANVNQDTIVAASCASSASASAAQAEFLVGIGERTDGMTTDVYTSTASQTTFAISEPNDPTGVMVFADTRMFLPTQDFTFTMSGSVATEVVMNDPQEVGTEVVIISFNLFDINAIRSELEDYRTDLLDIIWSDNLIPDYSTSLPWYYTAGGLGAVSSYGNGFEVEAESGEVSVRCNFDAVVGEVYMLSVNIADNQLSGTVPVTLECKLKVRKEDGTELTNLAIPDVSYTGNMRIKFIATDTTMALDFYLYSTPNSVIKVTNADVRKLN